MNDSFFKITFSDGTEAHEIDTSWKKISEEVLVEFMGHQKTVLLCKYHIKKILIHHNDLETELEAEDDEQIYQAVRSQISSIDNQSRILGRLVGRVKNGKVVEERFLDSVKNEVLGIKI